MLCIHTHTCAHRVFWSILTEIAITSVCKKKITCLGTGCLPPFVCVRIEYYSCVYACVQCVQLVCELVAFGVHIFLVHEWWLARLCQSLKFTLNLKLISYFSLSLSNYANICCVAELRAWILITTCFFFPSNSQWTLGEKQLFCLFHGNTKNRWRRIDLIN